MGGMGTVEARLQQHYPRYFWAVPHFPLGKISTAYRAQNCKGHKEKNQLRLAGYYKTLTKRPLPLNNLKLNK